MSSETPTRAVSAARDLIAAGVKPTIRKVADAVGVTPMALYNHFRNFDELLGLVAGEFATGLRGTLVDAEDRAQAYVDWAVENPIRFHLVVRHDREHADVVSGPKGIAAFGAAVLAANGLITASAARKVVASTVGFPA